MAGSVYHNAPGESVASVCELLRGDRRSSRKKVGMRLPSFTRPVTGARTRLVCGAAFAGAIYTSEADGTRVNQNLYDSKPLVYLNGGPQNQNGSGLPDGLYFF